MFWNGLLMKYWCNFRNPFFYRYKFHMVSIDLCRGFMIPYSSGSCVQWIFNFKIMFFKTWMKHSKSFQNWYNLQSKYLVSWHDRRALALRFVKSLYFPFISPKMCSTTSQSNNSSFPVSLNESTNLRVGLSFIRNHVVNIFSLKMRCSCSYLSCQRRIRRRCVSNARTLSWDNYFWTSRYLIPGLPH